MFITYHANTFNRIHFLKNLLLSFETCNVREDFEWIITDYGSTDGTRDFLSEFSSKNKFMTFLRFFVASLAIVSSTSSRSPQK